MEGSFHVSNAMSEDTPDFLFAVVLHPDTSGMPHNIGIVETFL